MKALEFSEIFAQRLPWFHLFELNVPRRSIAEWVGADSNEEWSDGLGNANHFAVEFDCGLIVAFECYDEGDAVFVVATEPAPQHVKRHLSHWDSNLENIFDCDGPMSDRRVVLDSFLERMPHLLESNCYQLMRQGDDGNQFPIGEPTSKLDASCWMAELEARGHKQTYWIVKR